MNISLDARILHFPNWSGVEFYAFHLLETLPNLGAEHTFHLHFDGDVSDPRLQPLLNKPNVVPHVRLGRRRYNLTLPLDLLQAKSRAYYSPSSMNKAPLPLPCPASLVFYDCGEHVMPEHYDNKNPEARRADVGRQLRSLACVFTISDAIKAEMIDLFGIKSDRIVVAPPAAARPDGDAPQSSPAGLTETSRFFLILNPGRAYKNWQDALAGFRSYLQAHPDDDETRLVLAGHLRGETEAIKTTLAADPHLQRRILCLGYVSDAERAWLYRHARLTLMPSRYEGFGMPVLEAMAYDSPVIISDIPVLREVAADAALPIPLDCPDALAAALHRLDNDESLRQSLIKKGQTRLDAYSWTESAKTTLDALLRMA